MTASERLEVWGDPIGHSRSPQLHLAAYRELGLDWRFTRREVPAASFAGALEAADVRGIAVTHPLKEQAFRAASWRGRRARLTGVANTLFFGEPGDLPRLDERQGSGPLAFNTDVGGIVEALREIGAGGASAVRILGAGATATSAIVALSELAVERVEVCARTPQKADPLVHLAERLGIRVHAAPLERPELAADLTIATLPGGTVLPAHQAQTLSRLGGILFDVAYSPWPSALALHWTAPAHGGLPMLLHQAVLQVRIFRAGDPSIPLDGEDRVRAAMRDALEGA